MHVVIRPAVMEDALAVFEIKEHLRLKLEELDSKQNGGFLLGTSLEEYQNFIQNDLVLVAECDQPEKVVGFAIVIRHETLAQSTLMQRSAQVNWETSFRLRFHARRIAFFEQLGVLPEPA